MSRQMLLVFLLLILIITSQFEWRQQLVSDVDATRKESQKQQQISQREEGVKEKVILSQEKNIQRLKELVRSLREQLQQCQSYNETLNVTFSSLQKKGLAGAFIGHQEKDEIPYPLNAQRMHISISLRVARAGYGELAEALAARDAIQLALRRGWLSAHFEGDCSSLIHKLHARVTDCSPVGQIVFDILSFASLLHSCSFSLVRRSGNAVAHCLARFASDFAEGGSDIPSAAVTALALDLAN
ncbi:UNVERIFIED_CONTAM: hypothetical protein Slati_0629000 [Sesamum latifolium]|uniref:RNase H type-1 domain-containing protein n=1 Tax=Sesamum latifolium TaxID=2727402 RepID=A0AAW2Y2K9_9LAMI